LGHVDDQGAQIIPVGKLGQLEAQQGQEPLGDWHLGRSGPAGQKLFSSGVGNLKKSLKLSVSANTSQLASGRPGMQLSATPTLRFHAFEATAEAVAAC
jgi:hypothetical protein